MRQPRQPGNSGNSGKSSNSGNSGNSGKPRIAPMLTLALDADDTLWHNEGHYQAAQRAFEGILSPWGDPVSVSDRLHETQMANMPLYGYGAKAFTLSMIETAVRISGNEVAAADLIAIIELGKHLLTRPVEVIDGVVDVLDELRHHRLMVITKGDLKDQMTKIRATGLYDRFWRVEVVADKDAATYSELLDRNGVGVERFVMAGNSLPSDVLPVLEIGGRAVHIPYHTTGRHELHELEDGSDTEGVPTLGSLRELPELLRCWGYYG